MGYKVSSFLSISPNDSHEYFLYFISGLEYRHHDLNEAVQDSFDTIASHIGPKGVIISKTKAPYHWSDWLSPTQTEVLLSRVSGLKPNGCIFALRHQQIGIESTDDDLENKFHNDLPYFIITTTPLNLDSKTEGIIICLDGVDKLGILNEIIDVIIKSIKKDDLKFLLNNIKVWERTYNKQELPEYAQMLELKPNIFGLGFNLNAVLDYINKKFIQSRTADKR